jgi:hypothetical protein
MKAPLVPHPPRGADAAALWATVAVLLLGAGVLAVDVRLHPPAPFALDFRTTPFYGPHEVSTHLSTIKYFFDARGQSLGHLAMTVGIALLTCAGLRRSVRRDLAGGVVTVIAILLTLAAWGFLSGPRESAYLGAWALLVVLIGAGRFLALRVVKALFAVALLVTLATVTLPGFKGAPDYSAIPWWEIAYSQSHYAVVVAPADLLGAGRSLFTDVRPDYGLVLPVLVGGYERRFGALTLGGEVRLLLSLQALYLAVGAWMFARHARGRFALAFLAFLTVVPWFHFAHKGLRFPNQTPWRTIGMALALVVLATLTGRSHRRALFVLGLTSGGALLLNFESGTAVTVACVVWACFRFGLLAPGAGGRARLESVGLLALGALAAVAATAAIVPLLLGAPLDLRHLPGLVANAAFTASTGFSGWPLTADPWPLVMFAHASFVLLRTGFAGGARKSPRTAFRAAVAALLVVWFAYYANRPHPWNLSSYYLPYGVLLVDLLRWTTLRAASSWRRLDGTVLVAMAVLAVVILPNLVFQAGKGLRQVGEALGPALRRATPPESRLLSGVWLRDPAAGELEERARFIREKAAASGPPIYLTSDSYLVAKLSGVFPALEVVDFCWQATTRPRYEAVIAAIARSDREDVYLDAPGTAIYSATPCAVFYENVRDDLAPRFERSGTASGWEVWRRRSDATRRSGPPGSTLSRRAGEPSSSPSSSPAAHSRGE